MAVEAKSAIHRHRRPPTLLYRFRPFVALVRWLARRYLPPVVRVPAGTSLRIEVAGGPVFFDGDQDIFDVDGELVIAWPGKPDAPTSDRPVTLGGPFTLTCTDVIIGGPMAFNLQEGSDG